METGVFLTLIVLAVLFAVVLSVIACSLCGFTPLRWCAKLACCRIFDLGCCGCAAVYAARVKVSPDDLRAAEEGGETPQVRLKRVGLLGKAYENRF